LSQQRLGTSRSAPEALKTLRTQFLALMSFAGTMIVGAMTIGWQAVQQDLMVVLYSATTQRHAADGIIAQREYYLVVFFTVVLLLIHFSHYHFLFLFLTL
jgi:hypothetical protein